MTARYIVGDVFDTLATLEDGSVDLVLTSPPFLALRSYLPADHPDKGKEIGSEATPGSFMDTLLALTEECARVLAPHGSLCVELGDTYSGSGGAGGDYNENGWRAGQPKFAHRPAEQDGWPLAKSLCLIPELYRVALVYGFNPLTGRQTPRWRARNVVRWCRPNPPVGALGDKFRPGTTDMVVVCKSARRYFDLDAAREPFKEGSRWSKGKLGRNTTYHHDAEDSGYPTWRGTGERIEQPHPAGAPPLDWWAIPTEPFKGAHYATFPEALCVRPIEAMCPRRVCETCGKPSQRITSEPDYVSKSGYVNQVLGRGGRSVVGLTTGSNEGITRTADTLGWSDCGHGNWRRGLILDPFAGSGTVLAVAEGYGRDSIGIDLDPRNQELAQQRCGMFLTVDDTPIIDVPTGHHL